MHERHHDHQGHFTYNYYWILHVDEIWLQELQNHIVNINHVTVITQVSRIKDT